MLMILIDAVVLMGLLAAFQEEELSLGFAAVIAIVTSIVTWLLAYGLIQAVGEMGLYLALLIGAVLLGIALSALYGMELKRAITVALIFMTVHLVASYALRSMMRPAAQAALNLQPSLWLS